MQVVESQLSRARRQLLQAREAYADLAARHRSQAAAEAVLHQTLTALAGGGLLVNVHCGGSSVGVA
jgi:hypothetical protein